jgi:hypothetical protein
MVAYSRHKQRRLDLLMGKNNEGELTQPERAVLLALVREAEDIMLTNAHILAQQQQRLSSGVPEIGNASQ